MSVTSVNASRGNTDEKATVSMEEHEQVLEKLRQAEEEKLTIIKDHGDLIKEFNRRMHVHLEEIRLLKEVNHKLQTDMQELRDLCCYLDDDRHKCRKLAREWQRFGRYTATAMRNEVSESQDKLNDLEIRESKILSDNNDLKELCLYLDQQRTHLTCNRICSKCFQSMETETTTSSVGRGSRDIFKGAGYSEKLEARLSTIGRERRNSLPKAYKDGSRGQKKRVSFTFPEEIDTDTDSADSISRSTFSKTNGYGDNYRHSHPGILRNGLKPLQKKGSALPFVDNTRMTPDAVEQAMKVLEIHEKLDHQAQANPEKGEENLGENEVAVLKEMCNVVWRKLSKENSEPLKLNGHAEEDEVLEDLL